MAGPWDPDAKTVTRIRERLLRGDAMRDIVADHNVHRSTIRKYATGDIASAEAEIGPLRSLAQGTSLWVRADREVVSDE